MVLISAQGVAKSFGDRVLFSGVSFDVRDGERVGLIGANGAGKTTLMNMFTGAAVPDEGRAYVSRDATLGHMRQHVPGDLTRTLHDEALNVFLPLMRMEEELESIARTIEGGDGGADALINRQHRLHEAYESAGGYTYRSRTRSTLLGLGFSESDLDLPLAALSGGERSRVQLARLLLTDPRMLLLDEPTNHLDIASVEWLEEYLLQFRGAILVISHDRYFLDKVTGRTLELENGRLTARAGNYSFFMRHKEKDVEVRERHRENTLREIKRIEGIIEQQKRWNRERNLRAARSKQKVVDRLREELAPPVQAPDVSRYMFAAGEGSGSDVLIAKGLAKRFGDRTLFRDVSFHIRKGEHVFLLGPNGCGKTTLLKALVHTRFGAYAPDEGYISLGAGVLAGYYDQTQESLLAQNTVLDEVWGAHPHLSQTQVRGALAAFLFRGEDVYKSIALLSGGERARVALVKLMLSKANFLLLDEPTNHLDIASREAFENALAAYDGTLLIVSHDRYLISRLAHRILYFDGRGGIAEHIGDYESYARAREAERAQAGQAQVSAPAKKAPEENAKAHGRETAAEIRRIKARLRAAEADIERAEADIAQTEALLSAPEAAADYVRAMELTERMDAERRRLERLYSEWEEDGLRLAALEAGQQE